MERKEMMLCLQPAVNLSINSAFTAELYLNETAEGRGGGGVQNKRGEMSNKS